MVKAENIKKAKGASPVEMFNFIVSFLNDHREQQFSSEQIIKEYSKSIGVNIPEYASARAYTEYSEPLKKVNMSLKKLDAYFGFTDSSGFFVNNNQNTVLHNRAMYQYPPSLDYDLKDIISLGSKSEANDNMNTLLQESLGMVHPLFPLYLGMLPERAVNPIIEFEQCDYRNNIYLPVLYDAIVTRHMVTFDYHSFDKPEIRVTFCPYYLKEYNRRWFVYGHTEKSSDDGTRERYTLDRIKNLKRVMRPLAPKPLKDYAALSKDLIGVSDSEYKEPIDIIIETLTPKIHGLIVSKPFHPSQKVIEPFQQDPVKGYPHGTIKIHVRPNPETYGRILYYSDGVKIVSPQKVVKDIHKMLYSAEFFYSD